MAERGPVVRKPLPPFHPVCRRPALLGGGPPPGPPRQDGLDTRSDAGGSGGGLLGLPGSSAGGMARATTHGPLRADGVATISEPERPRRRRSDRNPATGRQLVDVAMRSPTPRGLVAARSGRPPAPTARSTTLSFCGGPLGFRLPRQPPGVLRGRSRSASGATDARPGGGACGPLWAALKTYRNFEPLHRQPGVESQDLRDRLVSGPA